MQCKFHRPHLSKNAQVWLVEQIKLEIHAFEDPNGEREWPDNWIIATNIDPSGNAQTGAYDRARELVKKARPKMKFDIWGGAKLLTYLKRYSSIADQYAHFVTPGDVLAKMRDNLADLYADINKIVNHVVVNQFAEQVYTKLEQAGSSSDSRPGIHKLFVDLPFSWEGQEFKGNAAESLFYSASRNHRPSARAVPDNKGVNWNSHPLHSRALVLKGGPGQGKSTIGQYVAQVHRAAFILSHKIPVAPKNLEIAREIQWTAENRGHWPVVPRIPMLLELKDFAHWYGKRNRDEAKGLLTYVAIQLSRTLEMDVLPGTCLRALGSHKWFFIFDGLDEVPNDVKDAVGNQIRHFLEDVVAETDSDLLALCTSRPQGYSGQFDELDGPVVDLVPLPAKIALACCKPLVEMDRPAHEAEKLMQMLTVAIASPGVKELMTTPLQSHIMAIVVRDGGRPPERRWQLFSNFYQVMKKREVLKGFANQAIAKLLNEQDKLLKQLHSSLGFILHARAERSDGAQTQLSRIDFRKLVEQTVTELADDNIRETVEALMEATVERLVFVNTPDNAEHVRFDIRQLQEFFSAEHLYEDVESAKLRQSLGIMMGDAHWREVMHFLFSALIENGRATELAVAVSELQQLDQSEDSQHKGIDLRMARGALLAIRLLHEGVFEQDKKIRGQFRSALIPVFGMLEADHFDALATMREGASKSWFTAFAIDVLRRYGPSENIGAAVYLTKALSSTDERVEEVSNYLRTASVNYRSYIISTFSSFLDYRRHERAIQLEDWIIRFSVSELLRDDWWCLPTSARELLLRLLESARPRALAEAKQVARSSEISLLNALIVSFVETGNSHISYGGLIARLTKFDWVTGTLPVDIWISSGNGDIPEPQGILGLVACILTYARSRNKLDLITLIRYVSERCPTTLDVLPEHLLALLPLEEVRGATRIQSLNALIGLSDAKFGKKYSARKLRAPKNIRPVIAWEINYDNFSRTELTSLARKSPVTALDIVIDQAFFNLPRDLHLDDEFAESILRAPFLLVPFIPMLGALFERMPTYESRLREAAAHAANSAVLSDGLNIRFSREISPFPISLPNEASLLPVLIASFVKHTNLLSGIKGYRYTSNQFLKYIKDVDSLRLFLGDCNFPVEQRASVFIFLFMHEASKTQCGEAINSLLSDFPQDIFEFARSNIAFVFLDALSWILMYLPSECTPSVAPLVEKLLEYTIDRYKERAAIQRILVVWRERSSAPVSRSLLGNSQFLRVEPA